MKQIVLFSFLIAVFSAHGQYHEVLQKIHKKGEFNGTAIVIKNGINIYQGAFGPADKDSSRDLNINSVFRLA